MNKNSPPKAAPPAEIKKIFTKARRILKHPGLDILVAPTNHTHGILIVVTPGRIGTAVQRNTIRRRTKALFHEYRLNKTVDCIVIVKKRGVSLTYEELKTIILPALAH